MRRSVSILLVGALACAACSAPTEPNRSDVAVDSSHDASGGVDAGSDAAGDTGGGVDLGGDLGGDLGVDSGGADSGPDLDPSFRYEIVPFLENAWSWDQTSDTCAFTNNGIPWNWELHGREPAADGRYPVFLYFHGTGDTANGPVQMSIVESMAARGFVAASVTYDSLSGLGQILDDPTRGCEMLENKLACLFSADPSSPLSKACGRPKADCERGIVLAGHSQGSAIAIGARDYDDRVRAAYGLGAGLHLLVDAGGVMVTTDATPCAAPENRSLPVEALRIVNGESEYVYGDELRPDLERLTGMDCADDALECLRPDGSGWVLFPDSANEDGRAMSQHCYMANMPGGDCTASTGLNSNWTDGSAAYSREPSLDWLRGFVD